MPTLGTQTISSSFAQLLKTFTTGGLSGALQVVTDGDDTSSALSLSTTGVSSTGSFSVDGASILTGDVTFGSSLTASTGTATIGTLFASGPATFGTSFTASTGTATIGTLSAGTATISTATISTATIPNILGVSTFATGFTSSTGTNTIGTIESTTINNTGLATVGTLEIGGLTGPKITNVSYGTFAFSGGTVQTHSNNDTTTGTFALPCQLGDIVIASINSLGSTTGTGALIATNFFPIATDVVEYNIIGKGTTAGTIPAGTIFATALRFTV
jgi:hypothetical protein